MYNMWFDLLRLPISTSNKLNLEIKTIEWGKANKIDIDYVRIIQSMLIL